MRTLEVSLNERSYEIHIGCGSYGRLRDYLLQILNPGKVLLVSDKNVFPLYGAKITAVFKEAGFTVIPAVIPAGEGSKTLAFADDLYTAAIEGGLDRSNAVIALGGGVVGDLAGFAAATYLRGVPFIQIPTTLLAQVDSSVGGKVAVNHRLGKNLIGSFYQPRLVWIELDTLKTLPQREFMAGAAEVVKYGAIMSEPFIKLLEDKWQAFLDHQTCVLEEIITECCRLKAHVVVEDERETGIRAILNFGHTFGHALESATFFRYYLHGEAVLIGMVLAVHLAVRLSLLNLRDAERLLQLFSRVGIKPPPKDLAINPVINALWQDKKRIGNTIVFILPFRLGQVVSYNQISRDLAAEILSLYLNASEGSLLTLAD